jgi:hypothetical protein
MKALYAAVKFARKCNAQTIKTIATSSATMLSRRPDGAGASGAGGGMRVARGSAMAAVQTGQTCGRAASASVASIFWPQFGQVNFIGVDEKGARPGAC